MLNFMLLVVIAVAVVVAVAIAAVGTPLHKVIIALRISEIKVVWCIHSPKVRFKVGLLWRLPPPNGLPPPNCLPLCPFDIEITARRLGFNKTNVHLSK